MSGESIPHKGLLEKVTDASTEPLIEMSGEYGGVDVDLFVCPASTEPLIEMSGEPEGAEPEAGLMPLLQRSRSSK